MPYKPTAYKTVIASPGDVNEEREIARKVIHNWNDLHSEEKKIVLLPVGWETHSSPVTGARPQAIINKQILKNADLLIGIFWTRLGTPTGKADSGTVEEIEEHIATGKPAMLYFSNKQIDPQKIDHKQYEKVKAFKEKYKGQSLYGEFNTTTEFEKKLYNHLVLNVNSHDYFKNMNGNIQHATVDEDQTGIAIKLSNEAEALLIEASKSQDGMIMRLRTFEGLSIQTNSKDFLGKRDARLEAIWEDAVNQLVENGFIEDKGYKGEMFAVTRLGYEYSDNLKKVSKSKAEPEEDRKFTKEELAIIRLIAYKGEVSEFQIKIYLMGKENNYLRVDAEAAKYSLVKKKMIIQSKTNPVCYKLRPEGSIWASQNKPLWYEGNKE